MSRRQGGGVGATGPTGSTGATGATGPAPAGTGVVIVSGGVASTLTGTSQLAGFSSGSEAQAITVGSGLSLSAGTLTATGGTSWPGTSSQLTSGAGGAVSVAGRLALASNTLSTAAQRIALDANHILAYYCDDTSGTTIRNYGALSGADATIAGTYRLNDLGLFAGGTPALRLAGVAGTTVQKSGFSTGSLTAASLELTCMLGVSTATTQALTILNDNTASPNTHGFQVFTSSGTLYCGASTTNFANATVPVPAYYTRMHIGMSWDGTLGSNNITMYINGAVVAQATKTGTMNALTKLAIGCDTAGALQLSGAVADIRLSNIARPQSYFIDAAKAAGAL